MMSEMVMAGLELMMKALCLYRREGWESGCGSGAFNGNGCGNGDGGGCGGGDDSYGDECVVMSSVVFFHTLL